MSLSHTVHPTNLGSRIHFVVAAVVAVVFAVGLTSTAAMAGLTPVSARGAPIAEQESGADAANVADLVEKPYLEAEPEFAPRFQHVGMRGRPGRQKVLGQLGCALSSARGCRP